MRARIHHPFALSLPALLAACAGLWPAGADAQTVSPLPASNYAVQSVCSTPEPGQVGCMALQLVPTTAAARAEDHPLGITSEEATPEPQTGPNAGSYGLRPSDIHRAYHLPTEALNQQTIAIVDAYDDPQIESDLKTYSETFKLPLCTTANGCFAKVNQKGESTSLPAASQEWSVEISLDVETAHAVCESCHILLVEASSPTYSSLATAEQTAGRLGATEISNSWGGPESGSQPAQLNSTAFNQPGVVITASAGDSGYLNWDSDEGSYANFPASSPHVIAVGGTRLEVTSNGTWSSETVWNGYGAGGGGCSTAFTAPAWQQSLSDWSAVGCGTHRSVADVSADADPYSGFAVYDTEGLCEPSAGVHWCPIGGTSLSAPLIAGVFGLAGGAHGVTYPGRTLYEGAISSPSTLHDITTGSNGECTNANGEASFNPTNGLSECTAAQTAAHACQSQLRCLAATGYDGPSGVGTPDGVTAFMPNGTRASEYIEPPEEAEPEPESKTTTTTQSAPSESPPPAEPAPPAQPAVPVLSGLTLSHNATIARTHALERVSAVAFSFDITISARVRAVLAVRRTVHGHASWRTLPKTLEISAHAGSDHARMPTAGKLAKGIYRLTLTPAGGAARTIVFQVV
jgi:hypothetical protein